MNSTVMETKSDSFFPVAILGRLESVQKNQGTAVTVAYLEQIRRRKKTNNEEDVGQKMLFI